MRNPARTGAHLAQPIRTTRCTSHGMHAPNGYQLQGDRTGTARVGPADFDVSSNCPSSTKRTVLSNVGQSIVVRTVVLDPGPSRAARARKSQSFTLKCEIRLVPARTLPNRPARHDVRSIVCTFPMVTSCKVIAPELQELVRLISTSAQTGQARPNGLSFQT